LRSLLTDCNASLGDGGRMLGATICSTSLPWLCRPGERRDGVNNGALVLGRWARGLQEHAMNNVVDFPRQPPLDRDTLAIQFLKKVLPPQGRYCAFVKTRRGRKFNRFFETIDELWDCLHETDRDGDDAYFALGSYGEDDERKQRNVVALRCLWLDIDCGEGKPYRDVEEAITALKQLCDGAKLPKPMIIESGSGIHVHWPFRESLSRAKWQPYAGGLKAACVKLGLAADPSRTADCASILRAPGTHNRKAKPKLVTLDQRYLDLGPYDLAEFEYLFEYAPPGGGETARRAVASGLLPLPPRPPHLDAFTPGPSFLEVFPPADANAIANECAQLGHMRATSGLMPEPVWYACIGILAFCGKEGPMLAHEWSKGDPRYTEKEAQRKIEQCQRLTGATLCSRFLEIGDDEARARCEACRHKRAIASPISLGMRDEPAGSVETARTAPAAATSPKDFVAQLNQRHFLIRNIGGKCLVGEMIPNPIGSGQILLLQSREDFRAWYGNQFVTVSDSQDNSKRKPVGEYWLRHRDRRGYEGVDLVPGGPQELLNGYLNLWRGFGVIPKPGAWPLMFRHICYVLAAGDQGAAEYILRWAAWAVQHPGERAEVALALKGAKGCGKGVFVRALAQCFGEHAMQIANQEHLVGKFNGHLRSCLFLFADEAFWAGDKKGESVLKGLITEPCLVIEQKGIDAVQWPNHLKIAMAANEDWVVPASAGERRYAVFGCADTYVKGKCADADCQVYFAALHHELDHGGLEAMLYDLSRWDLGDWHPRQVYETDALREQKEQSLPPLEEWFVEVLQEGVLPGMKFDGEKAFASTRELADDAKLRVPHGRGSIQR
jgi:hypothetical protein